MIRGHANPPLGKDISGNALKALQKLESPDKADGAMNIIEKILIEVIFESIGQGILEVGNKVGDPQSHPFST
jgi:hypothetical protein